MAVELPKDLGHYGERLQRLINQNKKYENLAEGWGVNFNGDFLFIIEPDKLYPEETRYLLLELEDGKCLDTRQLANNNSLDFGVKLSGPHKIWRGFLESVETDMRYITQDGLKIEIDDSLHRLQSETTGGNNSDLTLFDRYIKAHYLMARIAKRVEVEYPNP